MKIQTDSGLVGWGEGTVGWKETAVRELVLDYGRRYVVGQNPFDIEDLWFRLYQIEHNTGPVMLFRHGRDEMALVKRQKPLSKESTTQLAGPEPGLKFELPPNGRDEFVPLYAMGFHEPYEMYFDVV